MIRILIVPDLKLVACPQEPGSELEAFRERWATFLRHDEVMNELGSRLAKLQKYGHICEVCWAFSDDMRDLLLAYESPWTLIGKVGWVRDLMITFPGPLSNTLFSTVEFQPNLTIQPNILADYVQPETQEAWKEVIWACLQQENAEQVRLASSPSEKQASIKVFVDNQLKAIVDLICQIADWDGVRIQIDPWFKHGLPPTGNVPYEPPKQWHTGQPLPTGPRGSGFVDKRGRTWVWDNQEDHWDVQDRRQGHGNYIRISPDGRNLD